MKLDKKDILNINKIVLDFIMNQDDIVLDKVLKGEYKLSINADIEKGINIENTNDRKDIKKVGKGSSKNSKGKSKKVEINVIETLNKLKSFETISEGREYLKKIKIVKGTLVELAKVGQIRINSNDRKEFIIEKIIAGTIGAKIKMKVLQQE